MLGLKKIFITEGRHEFDVTAIKHNTLDDDSRYLIDILTDIIDGNSYYITNIPLYTTSEGGYLMIGDIQQLEDTAEYTANGEDFYIDTYKVMPIVQDNISGLTLKMAHLVNKVAII